MVPTASDLWITLIRRSYFHRDIVLKLIIIRIIINIVYLYTYCVREDLSRYQHNPSYLIILRYQKSYPCKVLYLERIIIQFQWQDMKQNIRTILKTLCVSRADNGALILPWNVCNTLYQVTWQVFDSSGRSLRKSNGYKGSKLPIIELWRSVKALVKQWPIFSLGVRGTACVSCSKALSQMLKDGTQHQHPSSRASC